MFFVQLTTLPIRTWTWTIYISWRIPSFTWSHAPIAIVDVNTGKNLKTGGELLNSVPPYKTDSVDGTLISRAWAFVLTFARPCCPGPVPNVDPLAARLNRVSCNWRWQLHIINLILSLGGNTRNRILPFIFQMQPPMKPIYQHWACIAMLKLLA